MSDKIEKYSTQKANGLEALSKWSALVANKVKAFPDHKIEVPNFHVLAHDLDVSDDSITLPHQWQKRLNNAGLFARPAPANPAHGFLDSVRVESEDEIVGLYKRVKDVDPKGELILMWDWSATSTSNMIITPNALSVGPGNDGATEGKDALMLGVNTMSETWFDLAEESGVDKDHDPYLEVIQSRTANSAYSSKHQIHHDNLAFSRVVQCRAGELVEGPARNFVPKDITPAKVVIPTGKESFVEWRKIVQSLKPDTDVVFHPGGGLHCHWGVNAKEAGITYISSTLDNDPPKAGKLIKAEDHKLPDFLFNHGQYVDGFCHALRSFEFPDYPGVFVGGEVAFKKFHNDTTTYREAMAIMLLAFHTHQLQYSAQGSRLLGLGVGYACRLLGLLCIGEYRYAPSKPAPPGGKSGARNSVWEKWWAGWGSVAQSEVQKSYKSFKEEDWSGSYGGEKWQRIARYQLLLFETSQHLCRLVYNDDWSSDAKIAVAYHSLDNISFRISNLFNEMINVGHNCGWVFNKFVDTKLFDHAANQSLQFAMFCGPALEQHRSFIKHGVRNKSPHQFSLAEHGGLVVSEAFKNSRLAHKRFVPMDASDFGDDPASGVKSYTTALIDMSDYSESQSSPDLASLIKWAKDDQAWADKISEKDGKALEAGSIIFPSSDEWDDNDNDEVVLEPVVPMQYMDSFAVLHSSSNTWKARKVSNHFMRGHMLSSAMKPLFFCVREDIVHFQVPRMNAVLTNEYNTVNFNSSSLVWKTEFRNYESLLHNFISNEGSYAELQYWWLKYKYPNCEITGSPGPVSNTSMKVVASDSWASLQSLLPGITITKSMALTTTPYVMVQPVLNATKTMVEFWPVIPEYNTNTIPKLKLTSDHGLFQLPVDMVPNFLKNNCITLDECFSHESIFKMNPSVSSLQSFPVFKNNLPYANFKEGNHLWLPEIHGVWLEDIDVDQEKASGGESVGEF